MGLDNAHPKVENLGTVIASAIVSSCDIGQVVVHVQLQASDSSGGITSAFQPRRLIIAPAVDGCKRLLGCAPSCPSQKFRNPLLDVRNLVSIVNIGRHTLGNRRHTGRLGRMGRPVVTGQGHHGDEQIPGIKTAFDVRIGFELRQCERGEVFHTELLAERDSEILNRELPDWLSSKRVDGANKV